MELQKKTSKEPKTRLLAVDGLKGLAILAVLLTHIPIHIWFTFTPQSLHWLVGWIVSSGGVGVTIFFIVTGFLMGLLYPKPHSAVQFYARRYARLFPAFLVMVTSFAVIRLFAIEIPAQIMVVLVCIAIIHLLQRVFSGKGRWFIYIALGVQCVVAVWYVFYLLQVPAPIFYTKWDETVRTFVVFLVNATLTLPFGNYIEQLDGIYWALGAEVLFYLLYPLLIVPLVQHISKRSSTWGMVLLFLAFLPFCYGLLLASQKILGFGMLQLYLIIYFVVGVFIGINAAHIKRLTIRLHSLFAHPIWILGMIVFVFSSVPLAGYLSKYYQYWLSILMVIPVGIMVVTALAISDKSKTLLGLPLFTWLGKYSYAIFLTHSFVIHIVQAYIPSDTSINAFKIASLSIVGTGILAWILYRFVEHPYFTARKATSINANNSKTYTPVFMRTSMIGLICVVVLLMYLAYRPPVSLFTYVYRHGGSAITAGLQEKVITLSTEPIRQPFEAKEQGLGMVTTHVQNRHIEGVEGGFVPFKLYVRLVDDTNTIISESTYNAYEIADDAYFPFGFPLQTDSKGKTISIEYQLSELSPSANIKLITNEADLLSVYFVDKKSLLSNPIVGSRWLALKLLEPFSNSMFWITFLHMTPFLCLLFWLKGKDQSAV